MRKEPKQVQDWVVMSNSSSSDDKLNLWSVFLDTGIFFFFFCNVDWGVEDDGDFETGRFMFCIFNLDELLLGFIDRGVITRALFCAIGVGVDMYGVTETEVRGLQSFFFFFMGVV